MSKDAAVKDWEKFIGQFKGKTKYNRKTKLYFTDNAKIPQLSNTTVDVYARILEDKNPNKRTSVIVWFDMGDSYVNSESDSVKGQYTHDILTEYGMLTSKHHAIEVQNMEEKKLADLEKELKKLKNDNKDYRKEIEKAKESIAKNEKNIEINELDQTNKEKAIEMQKASLEEAKKNVRKFN